MVQIAGYAGHAGRYLLRGPLLARAADSMTAQLTIANLYPLCMSALGDEGNAKVLRHRAEQRGVSASIVTTYAGALPRADIYLIGGGWHPEQPRIVELLGGPGGLARAVAEGAVVLGINAGFQVLGEWFDTPDGTRHAGLGLLGARTTYAPLVEGPVRTLPNAALGLPAISGYECHRSQTELDTDVEPLARLDFGTGNGVPSRSRAARASAVAAIGRRTRANAGSHGSIPNEPDMAAVLRARAAANAHARAHASGGPRHSPVRTAAARRERVMAVHAARAPARPARTPPRSTETVRTPPRTSGMEATTPCTAARIRRSPRTVRSLVT